MIKKTTYKYHTSIETLPIFNYFKCTEGDFKYLYKVDDYEEAPRVTSELIKAWEGIQEDWNEAIDSREAKEMRMKYYRVLKLGNDLLQITILTDLLEIKYDEECVEMLSKHRLIYDKNNHENSIKKLRGEAKNIENKINELKVELKNVVEDQENNTFYDYIVDIEDFLDIKIDLHKDTVSRLIAYIKKANRKKDELLKQQNNG